MMHMQDVTTLSIKHLSSSVNDTDNNKKRVPSTTTTFRSRLGKHPSTTLPILSPLHHSWLHPTASPAQTELVGRYLPTTLAPVPLAASTSPGSLFFGVSAASIDFAGVLGGVRRTKSLTDRKSSGMCICAAPASAVDSTAWDSFESDANESRTALSGDEGEGREEDLNIAFWINGVRGVCGILAVVGGAGAGAISSIHIKPQNKRETS